MTYRQLAEFINKLTEEEKDLPAVVYNWSEYAHIAIVEDRNETPPQMETVEVCLRGVYL